MLDFLPIIMIFVAITIARIIKSYLKNDGYISDFGKSIALLYLYVSRCDGPMNKAELEWIKDKLRKTYADKISTFLLAHIQSNLRKSIRLSESLIVLRDQQPYSFLVRLLNDLYYLAYTDDELNTNEKIALDFISSILRIKPFHIKYIQNQHKNIYNSAHYSYNKEENSNTTLYAANFLDQAFQVFNLDTKASNQDVKDQYRKLVKQYHPDLYHNENESTQRSHEEKMKEINKAYEIIQKHRGF